jgi:hypothetical protein
MAISSLIEWIKKNFLVLVLLGVVAFLVFKPNNIRPLSVSRYSSDVSYELGMSAPSNIAKSIMPAAGGGMINEAPPAPDISERMVVQNSYLSLKVTNVTDNLKKVSQKAESLSGYMVNSAVSQPEESTTANITVRVPADKLEDFLGFCRQLAVKVVSENLTGYDVTDQYTDTQARIDTLTLTKNKFEEILNKAVNIQDILQAQREIINIQEQIDSLKGQNKYLEQTSKLAKVTVYLASDELALPYAPTNSWRPEVIFKTAVRSLVSTARFLGTAFIWIGVFSVIWVPIVAIVYFSSRRKRI